MIRFLKNYIFLFFIAFLLFSCNKLQPAAPNDDELLDGPIEGLTFAENNQFLLGDITFNDEIFTSDKGLGPIFVGSSCVECHAGDGKGTVFGSIIRFGQSDPSGNQFLHMGGPQLQNRALPGYKPETLPPGATYSRLLAPAVTGLGYLQYVTDADIIAMSDPNDLDNDGISGVPNWKVLDNYLTPGPNAISQNGKYIHRFGKKASVYDLLNQTVIAFNQDMGITSYFDRTDVYSGLEIDPEVSISVIRNLVAYLETLKAPTPRQQDDKQVISGKNLFAGINCIGCHKPQLKTGYSPTLALSYKTFYPYTDMLLHDMGPGLNDGYTEGSAQTSEWRTAPLWGLGLSKDSQGGTYYLMHDGRARSIEEAILLHGGEAENSKTQYQNLNKSAKSDILKFLESL